MIYIKTLKLLARTVNSGFSCSSTLVSPCPTNPQYLHSALMSLYQFSFFFTEFLWKLKINISRGFTGRRLSAEHLKGRNAVHLLYHFLLSLSLSGVGACSFVRVCAHEWGAEVTIEQLSLLFFALISPFPPLLKINCSHTIYILITISPPPFLPVPPLFPSQQDHSLLSLTGEKNGFFP